MRLLLLPVLFLTPSVTGFIHAGDQDQRPSSALDGAWQVVKAELAGRKWSDEMFKDLVLVIDGNRYLVKSAEHDDRGTVTYIPAESPKAMDIAGTDGPNKGKRFLAIYKTDGDTLVVCYDLSGKARPKEFKTEPGTALFLATYRKKKS
jgi:uncharacterized protein (TIGR03067 family)